MTKTVFSAHELSVIDDIGHFFRSGVPSWAPDRLNINLDEELFYRIYDEKTEYDGNPGTVWNFPRDAEGMRTLDSLMIKWNGSDGGLLGFKQAGTYVNTMLKMGGWHHKSADWSKIMQLLVEKGWRNFDVMSVIDLMLIEAFSPKTRSVGTDAKEPWRILEVGGGFGRLTEMAFLTKRFEKLQYVMIDAVPVSVAYSTQYLKKRLGDLVYTVDDGKLPDKDENYVFILPSWRINEYRDLPFMKDFDVCVNFDSFQEMDERNVTNYIRLFDDKLKPGGIAYLSNSRDWKYKGKYNYPKTWQPLLKQRGPRSYYTRNHPLEVFSKRFDDFSGQQRVRDFFYEVMDLRNWDMVKAADKVKK